MTPQNAIDLTPLFELDLEIGSIHTVGGTPMGHRVIADLGAAFAANFFTMP